MVLLACSHGVTQQTYRKPLHGLCLAPVLLLEIQASFSKAAQQHS